MTIPVALSTGSVYPESTAVAFDLAARLGYDGVEVVVSQDPVSQDVEALRALSDYHRVPVLAVHAPCLLITQRVWTTDPWEKLRRALEAAQRLRAGIVVVHPPFRWQREYGRTFAPGLARLGRGSGVRFAVENMFPLRVAGGREMSGYYTDWDVTADGYPDYTLDLSHTATSGSDAMAMYAAMGNRLAHVHICDGTTGTGRDEHLVPGRGDQPCAEVLSALARRSYAGVVVVEISTRRVRARSARVADLTESLEFTREHLSTGSSALAAPHGR